MTPEQEKAIRRREKKATKFEPDARYWEMPEFEDDAGSVYGSIGCQREEDLEFFLHARIDIPTLLAEVDRLRKEDARLREALEEQTSALRALEASRGEPRWPGQHEALAELRRLIAKGDAALTPPKQEVG